MVGDDGTVTLESNGVYGPPTEQQAAFEETLTNVIDNPATTSILVTDGSTNAVGGNFNAQEIDIGDIQQFGSGPGFSSGAILAHEIDEQFGKQVHWAPPEVAHDVALETESRISGYRRTDRWMGRPTINQDMTLSGKILSTFTNQRSTITNVVTINRNNITNVTH